MIGPERDRRRESRWRKRLGQFGASGLSIYDSCRREIERRDREVMASKPTLAPIHVTEAAQTAIVHLTEDSFGNPTATIMIRSVLHVSEILEWPTHSTSGFGDGRTAGTALCRAGPMSLGAGSIRP